MLTAEQHASRLGKLFATDAAPALGLSKYKTPAALWAEKLGLLEPDDLTDVEPVQLGSFFEPKIAELYSIRTGKEILKHDGTFFHPSHDWMGSHYDYCIPGDRPVEIKFFGQFRRKEFGESGSADVPMEVLVQCLHEMAVGGWDVVDVAVLFGNQSFDIFTIQNDREAQTQLIEREQEFMGMLTNKTPPPATSLADIRLLYPRDTGEIVIANDALLMNIAQERLAAAMEVTAKRSKELARYEIGLAMKDASILADPSGKPLLTWKRSRDSAVFDDKAFAEAHPALYKQFLRTRQGSRRFHFKQEGSNGNT